MVCYERYGIYPRQCAAIREAVLCGDAPLGFPRPVHHFVLTMMADNIEHVISYWRLYQKFRSPALE
jgi:hypothetical protein